LVIKGNENDKRPKNEIYWRVEIRKMEKINTKIEIERKKTDCDHRNKRIFLSENTHASLFHCEPFQRVRVSSPMLES
jgi:predicted deacetylase